MTIRERVDSAAVEELPKIAAEIAEAEAALRLRLNAPARAPEAADPHRLVDFAEAGQILGIPEDRARDLGRSGALPVVRIGKYRRVRLSAVLAYAAAHEEPAHPPARGR